MIMAGSARRHWSPYIGRSASGLTASLFSSSVVSRTNHESQLYGWCDVHGLPRANRAVLSRRVRVQATCKHLPSPFSV
ncbi:hypothetical protein EXIGLDRAFT_400640 [Exidia glandulosa HHB12029]|uniref:Uncharacterized protein n=1 Tax=Exidia glandulosa HHB12029 TaxID=1314781 RepID=A0A166B0T2_EXIGL|nr:hypothetical protein EXIGLDRAFT_400640 [Exidia glandulosa HHB12029]